MSPPRADALDGAEGDQLVHGPRPAGQRGADDEDDDGEQEDALAAEEVAELAVDGQPDGGGEQVGGDRPGHLVQAVQFADDLRERGGDDGLVERGEQQREHQPEEDQPDAAGAEPAPPYRRRASWGPSCAAGAGRRAGCRADRVRADRSASTPLDPLAQGASRPRAAPLVTPAAAQFLALRDNSEQARRRVRAAVGTDVKCVARGAYWAPIRAFRTERIRRAGTLRLTGKPPEPVSVTQRSG